MDKPPEVYYHNMEPSKSVTAHIIEKCEGLDRYYEHIIGVNVKIDKPNHHSSRGNHFHVTIEAIVPGQVLVASHASEKGARHESPLATINDAFHVIAAQLEKHSRKHIDQVKHHVQPLQGRIERLFGDHGFVELTDGTEVYFHKESVLHPGFDTLELGTLVRVVMNEGNLTSDIRASTIQPINGMTDADDSGLAYNEKVHEARSQ